MSKIHLDLQNGNFGAVVCGAETSWSKRIARKEVLDLPKTRNKNEVTCKNCRNRWMFNESWYP